MNRLRIKSSKCFIAFLAIALMCFTIGNAQSSEHHEATLPASHETPATAHGQEAPADGKFDPVPIIMHHVGDANEYNLFADITIPLPVMIYNKTTGLWFTT